VKTRLPPLKVIVGVIVGSAIVVYAYLGPIVLADAGVVTDNKKLIDTTETGVTDLRDRLHEASVSYGNHTCKTWTGVRWWCGLRSWLWVGRYHGKLTGADGPTYRACIWAHPHADKKGKSLPVRIVWPSIEFGSAFHGEAGLLDTPVTGGPARMSVRINNERPIRVHIPSGSHHRPHERKWNEWNLNTEHIKGKVGRLSFEITAPKHNWRHVCFTAFMSE
jgi:hypothetical protein